MSTSSSLYCLPCACSQEDDGNALSIAGKLVFYTPTVFSAYSGALVYLWYCYGCIIKQPHPRDDDFIQFPL